MSETQGAPQKVDAPTGGDGAGAASPEGAAGVTRHGLSKPLNYFFGIGDMFFTLMANVQDTFFNFFLTNIAMFGLGITTVVTTVTTAIDAALSWIYGAIMNAVKPMRWGRYRSWLLIMPWFVPLIYMFKFMVVGEGIVSIVIIIAAGVISSVIWNFGYVANMAIIPVVGKTPEDRAHLSSTRATYNRVASMLFGYMGLPLANVFAGIVTENYKFAALALVLGILAAVGYNIHFAMTKGYEEIPPREPRHGTAAQEPAEAADAPREEGKAASGSGGASGKGMAKSLFQNGPLISLLIAEFARWLANFVILGCITYYFVYIAQDTGLLAIYFVVANLVCIVGAFTSRFLSNRFGTKPTYVFCFLLFGCGLLLARFMYLSPVAVIVFMSIGQYGYGCIYSLSPTMFADASIYAEYKTGENSSGWIMGLGNVPLKIALVVRGLIINGVLAAVGFSASVAVEAATGAVKAGIATAMLTIPGVLLVIGGVILLFGFRLSRKRILEMSAEIEARHNG